MINHLEIRAKWKERARETLTALQVSFLQFVCRFPPSAFKGTLTQTSLDSKTYPREHRCLPGCMHAPTGVRVCVCVCVYVCVCARACLSRLFPCSFSPSDRSSPLLVHSAPDNGVDCGAPHGVNHGTRCGVTWQKSRRHL